MVVFLRFCCSGANRFRVAEAGRSGGFEKAVGRPFECRDIDALHPHHGVEGALGAGGIGAADQAHELARDDLPREAIAILDPAALLGLRHGGERVAQAIDLGLRFDRDLERNRLIEFEERPAIEAGECVVPSG